MTMRDRLNYYRLPLFQAPDSPSTPAASPAPSAPSAPAPASAPPSAPSTASPSPSSTPSDSPSEGGADSSSFEFMFGPEGGDPTEGLGLSPLEPATPEPKVEPPAPAQSVTPATTPTEPAKLGTEPATPAPTETTSPTPGTSPQPNLDPYDPGTLAQHLADNEEQVVQALADSVFKLSDKDVEALESDTVGTIPKLLARTLVTAQRNFLMQMANIVPRMVQAHGEVTKRHVEAEGEFYTRWPDIAKVKDQQVDIGGKKMPVNALVMQYAAVFRQMHPQASRQEAIEAVGPMVLLAAKVQPSVAMPGQPTAQTSPMVNGSRPPQPAPFVPAGPSAGGGALPSTAPQLSAVEAMFVGDPNEA